jgi:hypothetical protein
MVYNSNIERGKEMRNIVLSFIFIILFNSCAVQDLVLDTYYSEILIEKTDLYYPSDFDVDKISDIKEIADWINDHIEYTDKYAEGWRSVKEILDSGEGDCKSFALVFSNLYYIKHGISTGMGFVDTTRSIDAGGEVNHALTRRGDKLINPRSGNFKDETIRYHYSFNELFN